MSSTQTSPIEAVTETPAVVQPTAAPAATGAETSPPKLRAPRARKVAQTAAQKPKVAISGAPVAAKAPRKAATRPAAKAAPTIATKKPATTEEKAVVKSASAGATKTTQASTRRVTTKRVAAQPTPVKASTVATEIKSAAPATVPKPEKLLKEKKPKLVRDSFTIPKLEYLLLDQIKQRSGLMGVAVKKSELIRAGIKALAEMPDASLLAAIKAVPTIKTGRPLKD